ncbi:MAG: prefoldin subunit alpha [Nitrososphaerales archaeon]
MSDEEKKIQSLMVEFRLLESRLNEVNSQREILIRALIDARAGLVALRGLDTSSSSEVLMPLGGGVFVNGETPPVDRLLVGVGADVVVEKSRDEALKYLEERVKGMENAVVGLDAQRNDINKKLIERREAINNIIAKQQG